MPSNAYVKVHEVTEKDKIVDESDLANLRVKAELHFHLEDYKETLKDVQKMAHTEISDVLASGKQLLTAVIGEAGIGKSYLLKGIAENATTMLHLCAKKLATTGAAAHLIGGQTLHHFLGMDIYCKSRIEPGTSGYEIINNTDIIVIDESSLFQQKPLLKMDEILREIAVTKTLRNKPFGGKHIILMGNPAQHCLKLIRISLKHTCGKDSQSLYLAALSDRTTSSFQHCSLK